MLIIEKVKYKTNYLEAIEWFEEYLSKVVLMNRINNLCLNLYYKHKKYGITLTLKYGSKTFYIDKVIWNKFILDFKIVNYESLVSLTKHCLNKYVNYANNSFFTTSIGYSNPEERLIDYIESNNLIKI